MINWIAFPHFLNSINKVTAEKLFKIGQNPKTTRNKTDNGNLEPDSRWTNAQAHDRYEGAEHDLASKLTKRKLKPKKMKHPIIRAQNWQNHSNNRRVGCCYNKAKLAKRPLRTAKSLNVDPIYNLMLLDTAIPAFQKLVSRAKHWHPRSESCWFCIFQEHFESSV